MSETYHWATLDNSDVINLRDTGIDVAVGPENGEEYRLLKSTDFRSNEYFRIWEDSKDVYDTVYDWLLGFGSGNSRQGTMKGARIDTSYFKHGELTQLSFLYESSTTVSSFPTTLFHIATYDGSTYSYVCDLSVQVENLMEIEGPDSQPKIVSRGYLTADEYQSVSSSLIVQKVTFSLNELDSITIDDTVKALFIYRTSTIENSFDHRYIENNLGSFDGFFMGCMLRGTKDTMSFSVDPGSAPIYVPFIEYDIITNIIKDHTDTGFDKYHLSIEEVSASDKLSYSCPYIMGIKKINASNVCFNTIHISHDTLMGNMLNESTRPSKFNLIDRSINKIVIPINPNRSWFNTDHQYYFKNGLDAGQTGKISTDYGIIYLPLKLELYFEDPETVSNATCYTSTNIVVQSPPMLKTDVALYEDVETICEFSFDNIVYPGTGIWIKVYNELKNIYPTVGVASADNLPYDSISEMGITIYQAATTDNGDYIKIKAPTRNSSKAVEFSGTNVVYNELTLNLTAPVKVYFDFETREKWYDFVDEHIHENVLYQYETVNMAEKYGTATTQYNSMSSFDISGNMIIREDNDDTYYLTAVTFLDTKQAYVSDNVGYYLKIQDGNTNYISQNAIYFNSQIQNYIPTWLFAPSDKIKLSSSTITVGLTKSADKNSPFDSIWTEGNTNGLSLNFYSSNTAGCTARRQSATSGAVENIPTSTLGTNYVPAVLFSFKYSKIDDLTNEIEKLKTDLITLQASVASLSNYISS